ncbi:alpha/beta family hydrolase [Halomonas alkaliantarctica]|uniref:alpha/beta family hydrolase n=1 Tax=Halomonas alkaliantarctica TaxID=232346 RepID=UPI000A550E0F
MSISATTKNDTLIKAKPWPKGQGFVSSLNINVVWLADGDHDFKPRRISGLNQQVLIDEAALLAASFVRAHQADVAELV